MIQRVILVGLVVAMFAACSRWQPYTYQPTPGAATDPVKQLTLLLNGLRYPASRVEITGDYIKEIYPQGARVLMFREVSRMAILEKKGEYIVVAYNAAAQEIWKYHPNPQDSLARCKELLDALAALSMEPGPSETSSTPRAL